MNTNVVDDLDTMATASRPTCRSRSATDSMQPVLTIRARVPESVLPIFVSVALHRIRLYMGEHDLAIAAPPFTVTRPSPERGVVDVEAGWPTTSLAPGSGSIHGGMLPRNWLARSHGSGHPAPAG